MKTLLIKNLIAGYGSKAVVHNLSFEVREKETLVLMGTSGSGKTTLIRTILGILPPLSGEILLDGRDITKVPIEERNIGYLPQDYGLFPHLTVLENVAYGLRVRGAGKQEQARRAREALALVDLEGFDARRIQKLSGGERQRVGLARALAVNPDLLLLDEPLSNIDQVTKLEVVTHLKNLFSKLSIPVIFVTHNHEDALFLSGQLAILIEGKIEQIGHLQDILNAPKSAFVRKLLTPFEVVAVGGAVEQKELSTDTL